MTKNQPTKVEEDPFADDFFAPIANTKPYLKIALQGFAGTGKTFTGARLVVGLYKRIKSTKPVVIFDTEMAAKFLKPMFEAEGIPAVVKESRSLADLKETMKRCREGYSDFLIIDSISHVWENFLEAYKQAPRKFGKAAKTRLEFQDWGIIKPTWKNEFSDPFVRDPYHVVMTGRAGYEYENEKNEDTGKREIFKSGIKMKVEGETAYEPDILVLMSRMQEMDGSSVKKVTREAMILKDRSNLIDGKSFENPTYKDFEPAIEFLLQSPEKPQTVPERDAASLLQIEDGRREWVRRKEIALEKIQAYLEKMWPGQSADAKRNRIAAIETVFGTLSWTEIEGRKPEDLEVGLEALYFYVAEELKKQEADIKPADPKEKAKVEKVVKQLEDEFDGKEVKAALKNKTYKSKAEEALAKANAKPADNEDFI